MAGIKGSSDLFLNVSGGRLVNKKKEISYYGYEGVLLDIHQEMDEFEGKEISKIKLRMKDPNGEETAQISFSEESWYSQGFFARIQKVDLSKPFTLGISGSDKNEKVSFCWIKQSGEVVKADKEFARPTKTKRGKDNYEALIEETTEVMKEIQDKLEKLKPKSESKPESKSKGEGLSGDPDLDEGIESKPLTPPRRKKEDMPF